MGFESLYKLSVVMNMIDNVTNPMNGVTNKVSDSVSKVDSLSQAFGNMTQSGALITGLGVQIEEAVLSPVQATFDTKKALGELASVGVEKLEAVENAAKSFSETWSGTTKSDFITAAYDIKSGISMLSDEGVAEYTKIAALTATATKSTAAEMTSLFATGYGIYKGYYKDLSDVDFGEMFSAGIATSVQKFKTTGSGMAQAIQTLGSSATTSNVPLEEQLSILGMLQATMSGSEAGTKYKAFLRTAAKGGDELGLSFLDANNQLKSLPEVLDLLRGKFGDTLDATEKMDIQKAFGDTESVALIENLYSKTGDLQQNILDIYGDMGNGMDIATKMADKINQVDPSRFEVLKQKVHNVSESLGNTLNPTIDQYMNKAGNMLIKIDDWIGKNQTLVTILMKVLLVLGAVLSIVGTAMAVIGGFGLVLTKTINFISMFSKGIGLASKAIAIMQSRATLAGLSVSESFLKIKLAGSNAISGVKNLSSSILTFAKTAAINGITAAKNFVIGIASMAKQAIVTAVTALPGLIASVWSFTAALLANPITWVVLAIVGLIAILVLLWKNWDQVTSFISKLTTGFVNGIINGFNWIKEKIASLPDGFKNLLAFMFPMIGIPLLIIKNWDTIVAAFQTIFSNVKATFQNGIASIKEFMNGIPQWFRNSGAKIMTTFTEGIKSAINHPIEAVKSGLAKIRRMLPFSDAKEGPLSQLTLSGNKVLSTVATGIKQSENLPSEAVQRSFEKVDFTTKKNVSKVNINNTEERTSANGSPKSTAGEKKTIIQKVILNVDVSKIKKLNDLLKLLEEMNDFTNSNADDEELEPNPA